MSDARARQLHDQIVQAVRRHRAAMHTLAVLLVDLDQDALYRPLGYATLQDYAWTEHELTRRQVRDLLHLGRSLPDLPALDQALASGELAWTKARTLLPILTPANEGDWVARARSTSVRDLERQAYGLVRGGAPPAPHEARGPDRGRLVVDMYAQELQLVRDALAVLRAQADDADVSDGALLAELARAALKAAEDGDSVPTGEPYRIVLEHCPACGRTQGVDDEVADTLVQEAACYAEVVDLTPGAGPERGRLSRTIPKRIQRQVLHEARYRCAVPGCGGRLWLHLHHLEFWSRGGDHAVDNLVCLCGSHHRAVHEGVLAVERLDNGDLCFERANGQVRIRTGSPSGPTPRAPHVGHAPGGGPPPGRPTPSVGAHPDAAEGRRRPPGA